MFTSNNEGSNFNSVRRETLIYQLLLNGALTD